MVINNMQAEIEHASLTEIVMAEPRGFCAGVERAIEIVERALEKFGAPMCAMKSCITVLWSMI